MKPEPVTLICAPADALWTVPGSTFDRTCARCGRKVMIAPSGQRILREYPDAVIRCETCIPRDATFELAAGTPKEALREARTMQPNLRRLRN
jgi:DNA-directed RNA polymerase subunit RPC12/RpoP